MGVRPTAEEQKNVVAEQVGGVARALRVASDDLHDQGQSPVAGYWAPTTCRALKERISKKNLIGDGIALRPRYGELKRETFPGPSPEAT